MIKRPLVAAMIALGSAFALGSAYAMVTRQTPSPKRAVDAAPSLVGGPWLNTAEGKPDALESRTGKPTLVAFWTFACSNCQANMPVYARLLRKYRPQGVELISVHTPEMRVEHDPAQVARHLRTDGIDYPVLLDNDSVNWNLWGVRCWPTLFLLDKQGRVVRRWEGELNWQGANGETQVGQALDALLAGKALAR